MSMLTVPRARRSSAALGVALLVGACGHVVHASGTPDGRPAPFPAPDGPHPVGTILLDVEDTRPIELQPHGVERTIDAQVWYPSRQYGTARMPWFPRPALLDGMLRRGYFGQPAERFVEWSRIDAHALRGALPTTRTGGFPLVLLAPAPGVPLAHYTTLAQNLASRGIVVIGVEPRMERETSMRRTSADAVRTDEDIERHAADLVLVLRRFISATGSIGAVAQRVDLTRAGALGHARGGMVALEACTQDAVLRRCASLDGAPDDVRRRRPLPRPMLVVRSAPDTAVAVSAAAVEDDARARWLELFALPQSAERRMLHLAGASVMTFTDAPFAMPAVTGALGQRGDPIALHRTLADGLATFFRAEIDPLTAVDEIAAGSDVLGP